MKKILAVASFFCLGSLIAETFVVPKKKRVSTSKLKESIGQQQGDLIKTLNKQIGSRVSVQRKFILYEEALLENDQESFFAKADAQQLQVYEKSLQNLSEVLDDCEEKIKKAYAQVQTAEK